MRTWVCVDKRQLAVRATSADQLLVVLLVLWLVMAVKCEAESLACLLLGSSYDILVAVDVSLPYGEVVQEVAVLPAFHVARWLKKKIWHLYDMIQANHCSLYCCLSVHWGARVDVVVFFLHTLKAAQAFVLALYPRDKMVMTDVVASAENLLPITSDGDGDVCGRIHQPGSHRRILASCV